METAFMVLLFVLILLLFFSGRNNKANRWCSVAGFVFWLGVVKESFMYNIVPNIQTVFGYTIPYEYYYGAYSSMTWALYSLAMPTVVIFSLYFQNMDITRPRLLNRLKILIYIPALALSFFFPPHIFRAYQLSSLPFWITYGIYNGAFVIAYATFLIKGVLRESRGKSRTQKKLAIMIVLPPVIYWYITVFPVHALRLYNLMKLWQGNIIILSVCIAAFICIAFKDGIMGLRLTSESYRWNSDLTIINKGAEYTSHMLKNQMAKMEWCIENLQAQYDGSKDKTPEELAILSRSISSVKSYTEKIRKQSEPIRLSEELCNPKELVDSALENCVISPDIDVHVNLPNNVYLVCDKTHIVEVLANIISNAAEATSGAGVINITCDFDKNRKHHLLRIDDTGGGMSRDTSSMMFKPYFTTKNTDKNFGLGLTYCKNVVEKHGGSISAESVPGKGTSVTIALPVKHALPGAKAEVIHA